MAVKETEKKDEKKKLVDVNADKEAISQFPDLEIANLRFLVHHPTVAQNDKKVAWDTLLDKIRTHNMAPFYKLVTEEAGVPFDAAIHEAMKKANAEALLKFEDEITDAEKNQGESEVRQAWLKKYEYYCAIGDKDNALTTFSVTFEKTVGVGYKIDLVFNVIRLGFFFLDHRLIKKYMALAKDLMKQGGDWERKNRLRSYEALYKLSIRDFEGAADLFLEAVPTFGSYELMSYEQLIFYTVVACVFALDRPNLRSKVIRSNEIQEQLTGGGETGKLILMRDYLESFYKCRYDDFFANLAKLESERLKFDRYLLPHMRHYSREMRIHAYLQYLSPYKTVCISLMAKDFGVSPAFIDKELFPLAASGRVPCRIDAVEGIVYTYNPDNKNRHFKAIIRDGDNILNRIQKIARLVNT